MSVKDLPLLYVNTPISVRKIRPTGYNNSREKDWY